MLLGKQVSEISHHPLTNAFVWNILRWRFVCEAIVLFPVGDFSFGRALFETSLLRMTPRPLEKMPHLQEVFGIMVRDSHLQFRHQSEATATRKNSFRPLWWGIERGHEYQSQRSRPVILMFVCVSSTFLCFSPRCDSAFNPCITPVRLIDTSYICIATQRSIVLRAEYKYTNLFIREGEKKASEKACSPSSWTELQNSLELVRHLVFIQAESLRDGNMFGAHFPSLPPLPELNYCFSSSSLTEHIQKLLRQAREKHEIHSRQQLIGRKCFSYCNWHESKGCVQHTGKHKPTEIQHYFLYFNL